MTHKQLFIVFIVKLLLSLRFYDTNLLRSVRPFRLFALNVRWHERQKNRIGQDRGHVAHTQQNNIFIKWFWQHPIVWHATQSPHSDTRSYCIFGLAVVVVAPFTHKLSKQLWLYQLTAPLPWLWSGWMENFADSATTICAFDRRRIIKCIQLDVLKDKIQLSENRVRCDGQEKVLAKERERDCRHVLKLRSPSTSCSLCVFIAYYGLFQFQNTLFGCVCLGCFGCGCDGDPSPRHG